MSHRLLLQYVFTLIGFAGISVLLFLLAWNIYSSFAWQSWDLVYRLVHWMLDYIIIWVSGYLLLGCSIITYYFITRPLRYLDEIINASEQLARPEDAPIKLPAALKNVQDEMNLVREQALRNAMAAREAEQRKSDLIVYLAHDLKTPLTSIIGYLTLLRDEPQISAELRARYTGVVLSKAERLEDLINEFFDITRFSLSNLTLEPERVSLTRMLEQITYEFNPVLAEKELHWNIALPPDINIICDSNKLERVFDNLIRNAVNYSYTGTEISITLEQDSIGVLLHIKNHGKTIPAEKLSHIFEQFFRLDSSRATATGGAGLGLAIAKEIVELHGGSITAESADESITFTVRLPLDCKKIV